jgi:anti-sigma regulatory factor (Ser/Thr protein kinase)
LCTIIERMHSTDLTRGESKPAFDWWPPLGWWPEPARDLLGGRFCDPSATATFALPACPEAARTARAYATGTLCGWAMEDLAEGMGLVVSELATNALRHGLALAAPRTAEPIRLSLIRRGSLVTCAIADPGTAPPVLRHPAPLEPGGLGLHIVDTISVRWGWSPLAPRGKAVWAVLETRPEPAARL